ncbi:MAG TPA: tripartite tricarboxylate transporter substrate binding protein [Xanthobacteraceae bacterium]|nr:tripartite tricarboxylate transporter substrate binding protein [Xanthobacteraceae bacterium]
MIDRRTFLAASASAAVLPIASAAAEAADQYPSRPVRIIVPQAAGSGVDLQARLLAQKLGEMWGKQIVVEDRPGANAIIGTEYVAKSAPDGYTLVYSPITSVTTNVFIYKHLPYDPLRDLTPITQTTANPLGAIANPASGIKTIGDLVARAKAAPGKVNFGSFGIGNLTHLMGLLLSSAAGIEMTHVPYKGQTPEMTDVMAGQVPVGFTTMAGAAGFIQSGKLTLLATFGDKRDDQFPDTPTVVEQGYPSVVVVGWSGILAPAGVPKPIVDKLHDGLVKVLAMPDVKATLATQGSPAVSSKTPEDFGRFIKSEMDKFHPVIQAAGLEGSQ